MIKTEDIHEWRTIKPYVRVSIYDYDVSYDTQAEAYKMSYKPGPQEVSSSASNTTEISD